MHTFSLTSIYSTNDRGLIHLTQCQIEQQFTELERAKHQLQCIRFGLLGEEEIESLTF